MIAAIFFACWMWGHDFVEDRYGKLYCLHCGKRPK